MKNLNYPPNSENEQNQEILKKYLGPILRKLFLNILASFNIEMLTQNQTDNNEVK